MVLRPPGCPLTRLVPPLALTLTAHVSYYYRVRQSSRPLKKKLSPLHHYIALFSRLDPPAHNRRHCEDTSVDDIDKLLQTAVSLIHSSSVKVDVE